MDDDRPCFFYTVAFLGGWLFSRHTERNSSLFVIFDIIKKTILKQNKIQRSISWVTNLILYFRYLYRFIKVTKIIIVISYLQFFKNIFIFYLISILTIVKWSLMISVANAACEFVTSEDSPPKPCLGCVAWKNL